MHANPVWKVSKHELYDMKVQGQQQGNSDKCMSIAYTAGLTDDSTSAGYHSFIHTKDHFCGTFKSWYKEVVFKSKSKMRNLYINDGGGEFISYMLTKYGNVNGIFLKKLVSYTLEYNLALE